jgi:AcrR family transcriptional regulator
MPRPQLDAKAVAAFRARLAAVATRLFAEHGFEGVTMRAVAAAMGVSPMASYRYVADKDELLALVRTAAFRSLADAQAKVAARARPPEERVRALGRAYVEFALREPDAYRIMFELRQPNGCRPELDAEVERSFSYLREAVQALVDSGRLKGDALSLAHLFWATTHGLVSLHLAQKLALGRNIHDLARELGRLAEQAMSSSRPPQRKRKP